ncbi:MAG: helix-turn-helix domain-containing protein, partial [Blastocatellia bacterium]
MFQPLYVRPLTPVERDGLKRYAKSPNKEEAVRASVVLLSSQGKTAAEIRQSLGSHPSNIKKWIRKFNSEGLEGISAKKRGPQGGPRPSFTSFQVDAIIRLGSREPSEAGYSFKEWTPQKLATAAMERGIVDRISQVTVRQILKRHGGGNGVTRSASARMRVEKENAPTDGSQFDLGESALAQSRYEAATEHFQSALAKSIQTPEEEAVTRSLLSKALEELS